MLLIIYNINLSMFCTAIMPNYVCVLTFSRPIFVNFKNSIDIHPEVM